MNEYSHLLFFKHFGFLRVCQAHITTYQAGVQSMELENLKYPESWRTAWGQYFYILLLLSWGGGGEKRKKKKKRQDRVAILLLLSLTRAAPSLSRERRRGQPG